MSIRAAIFSLLSGNAGITAITGANIFAIALPESATGPSLTYQAVGGQSFQTMNTPGPQRLRVQFDAFSAADSVGAIADDPDNILEAIRELLDGSIAQTLDGVVIDKGEFIQTIDFFDSDSRRFRMAAEYRLFFNFTS